MTVTIHGDRVGGRAVGRPRTGRMVGQGDLGAAVQAARDLLLSGAWRTVPKEGSDADKALYLLRTKVPAALQVLPAVVVAARTKQLAAGQCYWCALHLQVVLSLGAASYPTPDEHLVAFLGNPCSRCRRRHAADAAVTAAVQHFETLTAAGVPPASASRAHDPRSVRWLLAAAQGRAPTPPPAPTGAIWAAPAGPRASVTAALQAGRRRKAPDPPYFRRWTAAELAARDRRAAEEGRWLQHLRDQA